MCANCDREAKAELAAIIQKGSGDRPVTRTEIQVLGVRIADGPSAPVVSIGGPVSPNQMKPQTEILLTILTSAGRRGALPLGRITGCAQLSVP